MRKFRFNSRKIIILSCENAQKNIYSSILLTKMSTFKYINIEAYGICILYSWYIFRYTFRSRIEFYYQPLDFCLNAFNQQRCINRSNMSVVFLITRHIYVGVCDFIGRKVTCTLYHSPHYPKSKRNYNKLWTNFYSRKNEK